MVHLTSIGSQVLRRVTLKEAILGAQSGILVGWLIRIYVIGPQENNFRKRRKIPEDFNGQKNCGSKGGPGEMVVKRVFWKWLLKGLFPRRIKFLL